MMLKETIINHPSELNKLKTFPFLKLKGLGYIKLSKSLNLDSREQIEKDINRYYYACGCDTGAKFLIFTLIANVLYGIIESTDYAMNLPKLKLPVILVIVIVGAVIGKFLGLYWANQKLKTVIEEAQAIWTLPIEKDDNYEPNCG